MHQYKIEVFAYTEAGSLGKLVTTRYADNQEQARIICAEYEAQKQENGMKAYKVDLHILCYKLCTDKAAFFSQFQA